MGISGYDGTWQGPTAHQPSAVDGVTTKPIKKWFVMEWSQTQIDPPLFDKNWLLVEEWVAPEIIVPNVDAELTQIFPAEVTAFWTNRPFGDPAFGWSVQIDWYESDVLVDSVLVSQQDGGTGVMRAVPSGIEVYVIMRYVNSEGLGPTDQSDSVFT